MKNENLIGKKILIVEDDYSSRLYLNKILEKQGVLLMNATDGSEAVDIVKNNPDINIVLMDIQLPVMNGYEATSKIRDLRTDIIIIAQTAYGLLGDEEKIMESGFDDYVIKPIFSENLIEKLVLNLRRRGL